MEGEGGADSGAPRASPRPPLAYEHLVFFEDTRCTRAEHERAVKQLLYLRTLGIAHLRGAASRELIFQMLQDSRHEGPKRTIWRYLDVAKPVALAVEIVTPATSEGSITHTATNMLAGRKVWLTKNMPANQVESVVLGVAAGSRVTSFDVASAWSKSEYQVCVEEVAADGTVGATFIAWNDYGTCRETAGWHGSKTIDYTPTTIAVETTATRFKVSVRHTVGFNDSTGVAIFRPTGVAP